MKKVEFLELAQLELDEAIEYYDDQVLGLGVGFLHEITESLARIVEYPNAWQTFTKRTRRCLIHRFPYGIIYQNRKDIILVIAIANLHRKPTYWHDRV